VCSSDLDPHLNGSDRNVVEKILRLLRKSKQSLCLSRTHSAKVVLDVEVYLTLSDDDLWMEQVSQKTMKKAMQTAKKSMADAVVLSCSINDFGNKFGEFPFDLFKEVLDA
jgi:hypothetical protein